MRATEHWSPYCAHLLCWLRTVRLVQATYCSPMVVAGVIDPMPLLWMRKISSCWSFLCKNRQLWELPACAHPMSHRFAVINRLVNPIWKWLVSSRKTVASHRPPWSYLGLAICMQRGRRTVSLADELAWLDDVIQFRQRVYLLIVMRPGPLMYENLNVKRRKDFVIAPEAVVHTRLKELGLLQEAEAHYKSIFDVSKQ